MLKAVLQVFLFFSVPPMVSSAEDRRGTGFVSEDIAYPKQPEKLAEIKDVTAKTIDNKRAYPLVEVCMALGYQINQHEDAFFVTGDGQCHRISAIDNPELQILNGMAYSTISMFNTLFGVAFRYQESTGLLSVFR